MATSSGSRCRLPACESWLHHVVAMYHDLNKLLVLFVFQFSLLLHGDNIKQYLPHRVPMNNKEAHICQGLGSVSGTQLTINKW